MSIKFFRVGEPPDRIKLIRAAIGEPALPPYSSFSRKHGDFVEDFDCGRSVWNGDASEISVSEATMLQAALSGKAGPPRA